MEFYLGAYNAAWFARTAVPLFVSHRTLRARKTFPRALGVWALDSGAFTEISQNGRWMTGVDEYVEAVQRYEAEIGNLAWAAPQDWMCEPWVVERTGKSVAEHQELTISSFLTLRGRGPFVPVLQGWAVDDYLAHVEQYAAAGVDLSAEAVVGIGSVCRRGGTREAIRTVALLAGQGIALHGFGLKVTALGALAPMLASSDSMAWSYRARRGEIQLPGHTHRRCTNCLPWALQWRTHVLASCTPHAQGVLI